MKLSFRSVFLAAAALYFVLLLAVPGYLVIQHYTVLKTGRIFKFEVVPYDPYDPFRGRYAAIRVPALRKAGDGPYFLLAEDNKGFAYIAASQKEAPGNRETPYVKNLVINRYYLNEKAAPRVERLQRKLSENQTMYIQVAVKNGDYVIEGMYVDGVPVEEYAWEDTE